MATIVNSIIYLAKGLYEDPSGNWHELDRAVVMLIIVVAYALIRYLKFNNYALKAVVVYIPTMALTVLYVILRGLTAELAPTAYRDIFINYTVGFIIVAAIVFIIQLLSKRTKSKE